MRAPPAALSAPVGSCSSSELASCVAVALPRAVEEAKAFASLSLAFWHSTLAAVSLSTRSWWRRKKR
jgi:hypothetical protein